MKPSSSSTTSSPNRSRPFSSCLIILSLVIFVGIIFSEDFFCILWRPLLHSGPPEENEEPIPQAIEDVELPFAVGRAESGCNVFQGSWVYDEGSRPHYEEHECPYIEAQLTCQAHGRPDKKYQHWRWQPHGCSLPSFNATFMLEKLRGKRMMFIGDSLNRGQFYSMVCLLNQVIPKDAKSFKTNGSLIVFRALEYNASIEYYWAPFLVESNADHPTLHRITDRVIRAGSINRHARHWKGVDILVFTTYVWWMRGLKMKILRGSFLGDLKDVRELNTEDAYRIGLRRMVIWLKKNIDPLRTRVFFTSMSPLHFKGYEWGGEQDSNCYNQTSPIFDPNYWGFGSSKTIMQVAAEVLSASKVPITVLNITQLSEYRRDGHASIYRQQPGPLTPEQLANPKSYADCVHWCLPGVPDTWNELLYSKLFFP